MPTNSKIHKKQINVTTKLPRITSDTAKFFILSKGSKQLTEESLFR